jgi:hypothetical protein
MTNPQIREARAQCALCGDIISSCTEYAEACCRCGAIGIKGGTIPPWERGNPKHIIWIIKKEHGECFVCPHCQKEFPAPQ